MENLKNHPLYGIMAAAMGEQGALKQIKQIVDEENRRNQVPTEFSQTEKRIIVPHSMNKLQAAKELKRQWEDEEQVIQLDRMFEAWNWKEVLVAVKKATEKHFGWIQGKTVQHWWGTERPREISIVTDIKNGQKITEECFFGKITSSVWEDAEINVKSNSIHVTSKKKYAADVRQFFDLVEKHLDQESIFRGKSITVTEITDPWGEKSLNFEIFELKVSDKIILNDDVNTVVNNFIIDDLGEEGKRCYLLSGGYGNGKTETAMKIGAAGIAKGMAYFYCKEAHVFSQLLKLSVNYQPCIVFLEDLDEIGAGNQRDAAMNTILNTLDGVQTKGNSITVLFTTNHEQRINPALRRPGRIDLVINFSNPEKIAVAEIYQRYLSELKGYEALDYNALAERTPECPGAVVAEIAKRAVKLCKKRGAVTEEFVKAAIDSMKHHLRLMSEPIEEAKTGDFQLTVKNAKIELKNYGASANGQKTETAKAN